MLRTIVEVSLGEVLDGDKRVTLTNSKRRREEILASGGLMCLVITPAEAPDLELLNDRNALLVADMAIYRTETGDRLIKNRPFNQDPPC